MRYQSIQTQVDLNDPEKGFEFIKSDNGITVCFIDWKNRKISFKFEFAYHFSYFYAEGYKGLPEGTLIEITDSEIIKSLTETHTAEKNEELHHYVISTNEGEWLEIVSDNIRIEVNG